MSSPCYIAVFLVTSLHLTAHQETPHQNTDDFYQPRKSQGFRSSMLGTNVRDQYIYFLLFHNVHHQETIQ